MQQPRPILRRQFLVTTGALTAASLASSTIPATAAPITDGLRVFTCGHSFHVWMVKMLADLAEKAGIKNHRVAGVSSIGGSRVIQHWDVLDEKNDAKKSLAKGEVDVLTLSPIWLPDSGIENFTRLAIEIGQHHPGASLDQRAGRGRAQARTRTGHQKHFIVDLHICSP